MTAQFKQDLYKNFSLFKIKVKMIQLILSRIELNFGIIFFINAQGPIPDILFDYDYNDEGLDHSVRSAEIFPEIRQFKKLLDILRCK